MTNPLYQSYIICTTPRSGSTLLCKMLAAVGKAGNPESYFHRPAFSAWLAAYGFSRGDFDSEVAALRAIFKAAIRQGSGNSDLFGLRMQRGSFEFFIRQVGELYPEMCSDAERIQAAFGKTLFIHLARPNKLDQAISRVKAVQTGLWHRAADGSELERLSAPQRPVYDFELITQHLAELTALEREWVGWFAQESIEPLCVSYCALSDDPQSVVAQVLNRLGLAPELALGLAPPVAKLADEVSQDWAVRFLAEAEFQRG